MIRSIANPHRSLRTYTSSQQGVEGEELVRSERKRERQPQTYFHEVRTNNRTLQEDIFAILENGSVETMLRYRLRFSTGRAFAIPTGQSKTRMTVMTLRSCARTFIAGPTMSIIESFLVLWRLVARARQSAPSGGNGRRVISVDRPLRLRTAPRERPGCSPASLPPEGTSWPAGARAADSPPPD